MADESEGPGREPMTIDAVTAELRRLRLEAGNPSYAAIAQSLAATREAAGMPFDRARIARSTVYDVFRPGRRRLDVALVGEILAALGLSDDDIGEWMKLARRAVPGPVASAPDPQPVPPSAQRPAVEPETDSAEPELRDRRPQPLLTAHLVSWRHRTSRRISIILLACVALNLIGRGLVVLLELPLHLDMSGTAISAIVLGPWWGALVGVATNFVGVAFSGITSVPFALVNVAGALVWGYGVRRFDMGSTIPRFFRLNLIAALVCSVVASPLLLILGDTVVHAGGNVTERIGAVLHVLVLSIFLSNLVTSLADKTISGFVALVVIESQQSAAPSAEVSASR